MKYQFKTSFASDNNASVHPLVMQALQDVNYGYAKGYGDDPVTKEAEELFKAHFGPQAETFFVFNGTGANVLALQSATRPFNAVICTQAAHINEDECGAPEKFTGCKLIDIYTPDAKLSVPQIMPFIRERGDQHQVQQLVLSLTQSTEFGTVYNLDELKALCAYAHGLGMYVHVDGARISNAAASLGVSFYELIYQTGVDILSFGGTKNGLMYGEAVVFVHPELAEYAKFYRKQSMQLASKMRYVSAQFIALLKDNLWHKNASHANAMAQLLASKLQESGKVEIVQKVQANAVFAIIPRELTQDLQKEYYFYIFEEARNVARFMCSWDTKEEDVLKFANFLNEKLA